MTINHRTGTERAGLNHSTVSKSLRRMQEAGLLTREPASHDRRVAATTCARLIEKSVRDHGRQPPGE